VCVCVSVCVCQVVILIDLQRPFIITSLDLSQRGRTHKNTR